MFSIHGDLRVSARHEGPERSRAGLYGRGGDHSPYSRPPGWATEGICGAQCYGGLVGSVAGRCIVGSGVCWAGRFPVGCGALRGGSLGRCWGGVVQRGWGWVGMVE
eukprot:2516227-Alexandrium_andersonii.AAC.1